MIVITPHEMKNGKITALHISILGSEKYEILEINPINFDTLNEIKPVISGYYDAKDILDAAKRSMVDAEIELNKSKDKFDKLLQPHQHEIKFEREIMLSPPKSEINNEDIVIETVRPSIIPEETKVVVSSLLQPEKEITKVDENMVVESPKEPKKPILEQLVPVPVKTSQDEAKRLYDEGIYNIIHSKGKNFNEEELSAEISKHVSKEMVTSVTNEFILLLQKNEVIKTKGKLHTFLSSILKK